MGKKIIIIGSAHPLRGGGLSTFNHRLCKAFIEDGHDCEIFSFSLQYPSFLFPGTTQYTDEPAPENIKITTAINSINPVSWIKVGKTIKKIKPDLVVVRYWLPFMSPCLSTILSIVKKNKHSKIVAIADNIIPHEPKFYDTTVTKYFLNKVDACITMSEKVSKDLLYLKPNIKHIQVQHPLYDNFGELMNKATAQQLLNLPYNDKIILFFGFIRKYKGLDLLLNAMADSRIKSMNIKLLIAGEFYEDEKPYLEIIEKNNLQNQIILHTHFIKDNDVRKYLCSADFIIQPYKTATQSGVTPLAYYFEKPMLVTNVGGLPDLVEKQQSGVVVEPNSQAIADGIVQLYNMDYTLLLQNVKAEKKNLSWKVLTDKIFEIA